MISTRHPSASPDFFHPRSSGSGWRRWRWRRRRRFRPTPTIREEAITRIAAAARGSQAALVPSIPPHSRAPAGYQLLRWWEQIGVRRWGCCGGALGAVAQASAVGSGVSGSSGCTHERQGARARAAAQADKSSGAATIEMIPSSRDPWRSGTDEQVARNSGKHQTICSSIIQPMQIAFTVCMIDSLIDLTLQLRVLVFVQISDWSLHGGIDHLPQVAHITSWSRRDTGTEVKLSYHPSPPSHSCFPFVNLLQAVSQIVFLMIN
jgi:hypothetical protein